LVSAYEEQQRHPAHWKVVKLYITKTEALALEEKRLLALRARNEVLDETEKSAVSLSFLSSG